MWDNNGIRLRPPMNPSACRRQMNTLVRSWQAVLLILFLFAFSMIVVATAASSNVDSRQRRIRFNDGWLFLNAAADGAERPNFDDSQWREVRLPHDWAIEGSFDPKLNPHTGALPIPGTGWYPGACIYRNVWLTITGPVHVAHWGTYVTTSDAANGSAAVTVKTSIQNELGEAASIKLQTSILDASGRRVALTETPGSVAPANSNTLHTTLAIAKPQRWGVGH